MLNEYLEFEAFTQNPTSDMPRLQPLLLTHSFSKNYNLDGIDQVLCIIARQFLFSKNCRELKQKKEATIQVIKRWIGMDYEENEKEIPEVDAWFKENHVESAWLEKYWKYHFNAFCSKESKSEKKNKANSMRDANEEWEACLRTRIAFIFSKWDYSLQVTSVNNILASAMELGPLKKQYCVIRKSSDNSDQKKESKRKDKSELWQKMQMFKYLIDGKGKKVTTDFKVLKNIIAFLRLQQEYTEKQKAVVLQKIRLFGWYGQDCTDGKAIHWCFDSYCFQEDGSEIPYSIMYRIPAQNYSKLVVDERFLIKHDIKLIDPCEEKNYEKTHWIIEDSGYGENMPFVVRNKYSPDETEKNKI